MKVTEEIIQAIPRQSEIVDFERGTVSTIQQCYERLRSWLAATDDGSFIVGKGGSHVYVSKKNGDRILLITE